MQLFHTIIYSFVLIISGITTPSFCEDVKNDLQVKLGAPLFKNLGNYHHAINTKSPLAQQYFDQGLILYYALDFPESIRSFQESMRLDPECAMCYWGFALAVGSKNDKTTTGKEKENALSAIKKAQELVDKNNILENAYIEALSYRYSQKSSSEAKKDCPHCHSISIVSKEESQAYANAMKKVIQKFPQDIDAKNLYAAALFDVNEWEFFNKKGEPEPNTQEIIETLESALKIDPKNPAANHYYIHVIETSSSPIRAMLNADYLRDAVPGASHLVHMPSHIYILTGRYHDSTVASQKAVEVFKDYMSDIRKQGFEPLSFSNQHNLLFVWTSAIMEGRSMLALETAQELVQQASELKKIDNQQFFSVIPYFTKARFGMWKEILDEPTPKKDSSFQMGIWHYVRGLAYTHLMLSEEANEELIKLKEIAKKIPDSMNEKKDGDEEEQLKIAVEILEATIAKKEEQPDVMLAHWLEAIKLLDNFGYREPPPWYFPIGDGYAAALLKIGRPKEAESVYKLVLKQYPENGWSLYGLAKSQREQGKNQEADETEKRFIKAWSQADIKLPVL